MARYHPTMVPSRVALLAALVVAVVAVSGCSLVSLDGLSGGLGPSDGSTGGSEAGAVAGYPGQVLADAPLAYWRFDELTGTTAADSSGHGNDATYEGGITLGASGAIAGDGDTAATFDGLTGFVTAGDRFAFAGQTPFSIEAWVSVQSRSTYAGLVSRNDAVGGPPSVVYANGESQGSQTAAFSIAGAVADFVVGAEAGGSGNYLAGTLDEVAVYDHALSADRVRAHYLAGRGSP